MNDLHQQLNELFAIHSMCININHGIRHSYEPWKLFIPSHFIYSFFTFNSIYSFNWDESFTKSKALDWASHTPSEKELKESKKIRCYIKFLYKTLGDGFPKLLHQKISNHLDLIGDPIREIQNIIPDERITPESATSFKKHFTSIWNKQVTGKKHRDSVNKIAYFIYCVRNNIFHGTKNTIQMMEEGQQQRLKIYTSILTGLNHLLFIAAKNELNWKQPTIKIKNHRLTNEVRWKRAFIWSGFKFNLTKNKYDFCNETKENKKYLRKILDTMGFGSHFDGSIFSPETNSIDKRIWLDTLERLHSGAEGGSYDELPIMDTYVAGIVRIINELGLQTCYSCDGHGKQRNRIRFSEKSSSYKFDACLIAISKGKYRFTNYSIVTMRKNALSSEHTSRKCIRYYNRDFLLEVAELLHKNRDKALAIITSC
jgi:hypothetical protein